MRKYTTEDLVSQKPNIDEFKSIIRNPLVFILHNIRSLQNVGLFFRLADALLVEKIYLTGYTGYPRLEDDDRSERIITHAENEINKTAIKLVPYVPWERSETIPELPGYQMIGVEQTDKSLDYSLPTTDYRFPLALIFGHERTGVEEDILKKCDFVIHIPMLGMGNSHNVAMSGAIIANHILQKVTPSGKL
ncbi:hypothetical protein A2872_00955 [Candidatus Gottesmanbacteria bacterium RIFCSPHIGHO2_01_FULL_42_12]|uniref:tRNA/rRNA methyltransferase SpoU type domain-containing protein n=1 Tax=Candidatus Gottesmanbacteria bacterium RIFCSPHIGHO2_01_FULL_42_12 TaxID=1798377 RepID=A0A1F5Z344_9BACT|nr:MAG: hypothetical protein A2872_00955 [Candidatus Gottesmanbacteria bacterium RIFCSPHIGHO2_01_FULL_42_12]